MTNYQDCEEGVVIYGSRIGLQVRDKSYVQAERHEPFTLSAGRPTIQSWEIFTIVPAIDNWDAWGWWVCDGHWIALKTGQGTYVMADHSPQGSGEMRAYQYTKSIDEWEKFQVRFNITEITEKPLRYNTPFFLKAKNGTYITLEKQRLGAFDNYGRRSYHIGDPLRFVDPRIEVVNQVKVDIQKAQKEIEQQQADIKKQKLEIQQQREQVVRQTRELAEETATREQEITQRQTKVKIEHDVLVEWAQNLERQQSDLQLIQALHEEWKKEHSERDERKLQELKKRGDKMKKAVGELQERQKSIKSLLYDIASLREQRNELKNKLSSSPDIENLKAQAAELESTIQKMKAQTDSLQQQKQHCEDLEARRYQLEENIERLLTLAGHLPELRQQVEILEGRLTVFGQEAESLETFIASLTPKIVCVQEATLKLVREEVRNGLITVTAQEEELRTAEQEMRDFVLRYEQASTMYEERLQVLRLYQEANRRVAEALATHGNVAASGSQPTIEAVADSVDSLLRQFDRSLRAAIEANVAAGRVEHLAFTSG